MPSILSRVTTWLFQLRGPERGEVVLVQRRIFILPTRAGVLFALVLVLMLTGSINYELSLGFILTFLLAGVGIAAMIHTFRNLAGLRIGAAKTGAVFAGETARFGVALRNPTRTPRYSVALTRDKVDAHVVDVPAEDAAIATAAVPAERRGRLSPGRLTVYTRFPLGLFYGWSYIELDTQCLVYPRPAPPGLPLPPLQRSDAQGAGHGPGHDDFAGLREYRPGDSPRHIAWKTAARDQVLLTKQFAGLAPSQLWLSLDLAPAQLGLEEKLSHLTRWVLDAHARTIAYGLALPQATIDIGSGEAHRDRCLAALALA